MRLPNPCVAAASFFILILSRRNTPVCGSRARESLSATSSHSAVRLFCRHTCRSFPPVVMARPVFLSPRMVSLPLCSSCHSLHKALLWVTTCVTPPSASAPPTNTLSRFVRGDVPRGRFLCSSSQSCSSAPPVAHARKTPHSYRHIPDRASGYNDLLYAPLRPQNAEVEPSRCGYSSQFTTPTSPFAKLSISSHPPTLGATIRPLTIIHLQLCLYLILSPISYNYTLDQIYNYPTQHI